MLRRRRTETEDEAPAIDLADALAGHLSDDGPTAIPDGRSARRRSGGETEEEPQQGGYWTTEALFESSRRVESDRSDVGVLVTDSELLAELFLPHDADGRSIATALRNLAKAHHPDRWTTAPEDVRQEHAERMLHINEVVATLRARGRV